MGVGARVWGYRVVVPGTGTAPGTWPCTPLLGPVPSTRPCTLLLGPCTPLLGPVPLYLASIPLYLASIPSIWPLYPQLGLFYPQLGLFLPSIWPLFGLYLAYTVFIDPSLLTRLEGFPKTRFIVFLKSSISCFEGFYMFGSGFQ